MNEKITWTLPLSASFCGTKSHWRWFLGRLFRKRKKLKRHCSTSSDHCVDSLQAKETSVPSAVCLSDVKQEAKTCRRLSSSPHSWQTPHETYLTFSCCSTENHSLENNTTATLDSFSFTDNFEPWVWVILQEGDPSGHYCTIRYRVGRGDQFRLGLSLRPTGPNPNASVAYNASTFVPVKI